MLPSLREDFNRRWTPGKYQHFLASLAHAIGRPVDFRHSETPCFFPRDLLQQMSRAGRELVSQLLANPAYLAASAHEVPPQYRVPNEARQPLFIQADFGIVHHAGRYAPKLVEIQGFPSLYAYQTEMARQYLRAYDLDPNLQHLLSGLDLAAYHNLLGEAILNGHSPENVILLEIDPQHQKTLCDFICTERIYGVRPVCITQLIKRGNKLFYNRDGIETPVHRIYNRVIFDELERKQIAIPFAWTDDLQLEWAGHPNWFYRLSKFSLPWLNHATVPTSHFFHQLAQLPPDPENWVLKPLYSFAGLGVIVGPTRAQLEAIPTHDRHNYILQQRVPFSPVIATPHGPTMVEVRIMYIWLPSSPAPRPANMIVRMGRGKQMGVDHNKNLEWVGASAGFYL
ncbi:MAG: hypothetical protein K7J46_22005 [Bryobacter sp.]|jgi:hypothetical protein|nr:hypothetical protein [Bryobacter sp. CoA8 C33]